LASNENLANLVDQGRFRRDLYYSLNVFPIDLPPLRERRDDILDLAERFLAHYARRYGSPARTFSSDAQHAWPVPAHSSRVTDLDQSSTGKPSAFHSG
jgi:NtrC-family two-component system response regulator AlgB